MKHLYTMEGAETWRKKQRTLSRAAWAAALIGLLGCILLCTRVGTANASSMLAAVVALSTLAGWAVICLVRFGLLPAKAEAEHFAGVLAGEASEEEGILTLDMQRWIIPHSVAFRKVKIERDGEIKTFNVDANLSHLLPKNGTPVRVLTVRKFITAYEVLHEEK